MFVSHFLRVLLVWPHSNVVAEMTLQLNEGTASLQRAHQVYELILPGEIACP